MKKNKGITLIALVITIIVLLILAGVTINAISGSDSAPAKANEAGQKNDIGAAKDDISLTAVNAKMQGMETAYVGNNVSANNASTTVGQTVIDAILEKDGTTFGQASVEVEQALNSDATIIIETKDFEIEGIITIEDGILTWGEIEGVTPGLTIKTTSLILAPGDEGIVRYKLKGVSGNIFWTSDNEKISVINGIVRVNSNATETDTATITATIGEYTKTCSITVQEKWNDATIVGLNNMIGTEILDDSYIAKDNNNNDIKKWQIFYAEGDEVFLISTDVLEGAVDIGGTDTTSNHSDYTNGAASTSLAVGTYGRKYNSIWFEVNNMPDIAKTNGVNNNNAKTVAYLCDENKWTRYKVDGIANYAVGGPTIELLAKSVKAHRGTDYFTQLNATGTGYNNPFSEVRLGAPYKKSRSWWIASPRGSGEDNVFFLETSGQVRVYPYNASNTGTGIRPVVSIPLSKVKIKGLQVKIVP